MRILVLWETEREQEAAENLANVLVTMAPSLAMDARVENGTVTINHGCGGAIPKVLVRVASWASHFDQLMRTVLEL